jgi:hypothetical protein
MLKYRQLDSEIVVDRLLFPMVTGQIEGRQVGLMSGRFSSDLQFLKLIELC